MRRGLFFGIFFVFSLALLSIGQGLAEDNVAKANVVIYAQEIQDGVPRWTTRTETETESLTAEMYEGDLVDVTNEGGLPIIVCYGKAYVILENGEGTFPETIKEDVVLSVRAAKEGCP